MHRYIATRLALSIPTLLFVAVVVFTLVRLIPGDAATMLLADAVTGATSNEAAEVLREKLGLNRPYHEAFLSWLGGLAQGDLGNSLRTGEPIAPELARRIPVSLELTILSMVIALIIGVPGGILSAIRSESAVDYLGRFFSVFALSVPNFWMGILLVLLPFQWFGYSPPITYVGFFEDPVTNLRMLFLPSLALGAGLSAAILRMTRTNLLEVVRQDYIRTARAKGLNEQIVVLRHALKNALIPSVEIVMSQFGRLLSGVVVIEVIFVLPGVGRATVDAIFQRDYIAIQAFVLFAATTVLVLNLLSDVVYAWLDPRIRYD